VENKINLFFFCPDKTYAKTEQTQEQIPANFWGFFQTFQHFLALLLICSLWLSSIAYNPFDVSNKVLRLQFATIVYGSALLRSFELTQFMHTDACIFQSFQVA